MGNTALQDLGKLTALADQRIEPGAILWDRFCVVGEARELHSSAVLRITDLARELGKPDDQHRLDLHLLPTPATGPAEARLYRALAVDSPVQPQVFALGRVANQLVLVCEPRTGRPITGSPGVEAKPARLGLATVVRIGERLAQLLAKLHAADVRGVRFTPAMLRLDGGELSLDQFTYLLDEAVPTPEAEPSADADPDRNPDSIEARDVEALVDLIDELGQGMLALGSPATIVGLEAVLERLTGSTIPTALPVEPPFVGRSQALAELDRGFDQAQIAQPMAIVVRGHRGVGKSRLLSEFVAARIAKDDSIVLTGSWRENSADSRGGLLNALEQLPKALAQLDPDERDNVRRRINRATRHLGGIVTRTAPALGSVLRNVEQLPPLELGEDFSRRTAVIADLLRAVGTHRRPLVLALDNLESIDASSAAILKILAQPSPAHHSVVVMGLRHGATPPELEHSTIELGPLSSDELEQLIHDALTGEVADVKDLGRALWSTSEGLPLVAWANLRDWVERGRIEASANDGVWRARGQLRGSSEVLDLVGVFGARLRETPAAAQQLALHAAVWGAELDELELEWLGPSGERELGEAVAALVSRGLLAQTHHGVRFPHESIREAVFELFDADARRSAHAHVAELLIQTKAPIAQIAYHRELALDPTGNTASFDRLSRLHIDAGSERLAVYDLERARWHLERALDHSRDSDQRALAAEGLADICLLSNDLDTAVSLYTAIIATSEAPHALQTAAKAVLYLFSKSHNRDAQQLGNMALEAVAEVTPTTILGKIAHTLAALVQVWIGRQPKLAREIREGLCRLYPYMLTISVVDNPSSFPLFLARARWMARGLDSSSATMVRSFEASMWATFGRFRQADEIFADAQTVASTAGDHWARGVVLHNWALASLMPSDRYEEGQDMFDDAIAAFRETGDVSVSILSMLFKGLFGRDREPAQRVLGWFGEAIATASRNGKSVATAPLEALTLHVRARQGRTTDLGPRITSLAAQIERDDVSGIDRLMARAHLALAALANSSWEIAVTQVRAANREVAELPGIPDFCQELYLATALVLLDRPLTSKADRRLLRTAIRKFRGASKRSPRLRPLMDLVELQLAMRAHDQQGARRVASKIVRELDVHENLHVAREAHRALSRLLKGENVLAAAEHERVARNLGLRLGLTDQALVSDFTEIEREAELLALDVERSGSGRLQAQLPAAGMLSTITQSSIQRRRAEASDDEDDVLEAWDLNVHATPSTKLRQLLPPIRDAVKGAIDSLELRCPTPSAEVPLASSDLQILIINMLLTSRDAVSGSLRVSTTVELVELDDGAGERDHGRSRIVHAGQHLAIRVRASGTGGLVGLVSSFATCEALVTGLHGHLDVSTDPSELALDAYIPTHPHTPAKREAAPTVVIVHPDAGVRETVEVALAELGAKSRSFEPAQFEPTKVEHSTLILADPDSLRAARALEPLLSIRCYALVKRGASDAGRDRGRTLRVPFELTELEQILRGDD